MRYQELLEDISDINNINDELISLFIIMKEKNIDSIDLDNLFKYFSDAYNLNDKKEFIKYLTQLDNYVSKISDNKIYLNSDIGSSEDYVNSSDKDEDKEKKKVSLLAAKVALNKIRNR